jgi:CubicO group peptidase (beta-lactamase class C family)
MRLQRAVPILLPLLPLVVACGRPAEYTPTDPGDVVPGDQDFSALDAVFDEQLSSGQLGGFAMQVTDADGAIVYRREEGECRIDQYCGAGDPEFTVSLVTSVASSSKWVTSTVILAGLDEGVREGRFASVGEGLDTPVVPGLGCGSIDGPVNDITLRQLLSFTSGLIADHDCTTSNASLQECACQALQDSADAMTTDTSDGARTKAHPPGTTYKYGATHHAVAGAWLERQADASWDELLERYVRGPLGVSMEYSREANLAGSLETSVVDYTLFADALRADSRAVATGDEEGTVLLSAEALAEQRAAQVPADAVVLLSPDEGGFEYGLNVWRWCTRSSSEEEALGDLDTLLELVDPACDEVFQLGHGGKGGYSPFVDDQGRYAAVLSVREESAGAGDEYTEDELVLSARTRLLVHLAMTSTR